VSTLCARDTKHILDLRFEIWDFKSTICNL